YWTCESPYLYHITFEYGQDRVETYFALREVSIKEVGGLQRICINGKPVFFNGVLDQGYFQDGIFTPKSPEEYKKDIMRMKELGFNTLRKHIKVEPEIFYYLCDSLGIYLVQDMVNNGSYSFMVDTVLATAGIKLNDKGRYGQEQKEWFRLAAFETQNFLANNPSVIAYTVFNEGWGQTDSDQIGDELKERDPSRIYDYTSGWFKQTHSDVDSLHIYFRTKKLAAKNKALVLSEFGGFSRAVEGHIWNPSKSYGYGKCKDQEELTQRIIETYKKMVLPAIPKGLCACIYTQLSDIEDEINGFYTYDREVCKVDKEAISGFMKKII
ncbi:MAG: glycoside hydrolase family 2, partial [Treponema sp.]|nr:glycoside hydrolase family 2 [Treponema sp.]